MTFCAGTSILGFGGSRPPDFGLGGRGGHREIAWGGRGRVSKKYSVFCTESMLENVFLIRKFAEERLFMGKKGLLIFLSRGLKKVVRNFCLENEKFIRKI